MTSTTKYVNKMAALLVAALLTTPVYAPPASGATLLPNGEQTFVDQNGLPIAAGCVYFFVSGTNVPKDTYVDPAGASANTNPVVLDAAGRAVIYGVGTYRQVVKKYPCGPTGEQVWDQLTADTASSTTIFAGASAGTPNSITVVAPAFTGVDGQIINYISTNTNTAAATINPSGFGAVQIVRDSASGPGALIGGELVATNAVSLMYDATAGVFHILSPVTWPNTSGVPVGATIDVRGFNAPTNYAFTYGQAVSRTTYPALLAALTSVQTGSISSGSPTITGLSDTSQLGYGMPVESVGINAGTTVLRCDATTCTMSANATTTRSGNMTFFANGNGDGSLTFNLPDDRGKVLVGRDNMGGTAGNIAQVSTTITTTSSSTTTTVASSTGIQLGMFVINPNVPPTARVTGVSALTVTISPAATGSAIATPVRFSQFPDPQTLGSSKVEASFQLSTLNLPAYTPSGAIAISYTGTVLSSGSTLNGVVQTNGVLDNAFGTPGTPIYRASSSSTFSINAAYTGNAQGGVQTPVGLYQPSNIVNRAIRLVP